MRLGINTAFAIKRWPLPAQWLELVRGTLGLDLIQFSTDQLSPHPLCRAVLSAARSVKEEAARRGITVHSVQVGLAYYTYNGLLDPDPGLRQLALEWCLDAVRLTAEVGAEGFGGPLGALSVVDAADAARRSYLTAWAIEAVGRIGEEARKAGLNFLLWEPTPIPRELTSTIAETEAFVRQANAASPIPVKLCIDVGHACRPGAEGTDADPYAWLQQLGERVGVVHLQQTDGKGDHHWPFIPEFNERGLVTPAAVARAVKEGQCEDVPVVLEVFHPFEAPDSQVIEEVRQSVAYWKALSQ